MSDIEWVRAIEVLDSRGNPTLEAEVRLSRGHVGRAIVPSGASVGSLEAIELRDNQAERFHGKGVLRAIHNVENRIAPLLNSQISLEQQDLDDLLVELDDTENKSSLGANATLGVSLAFARAQAKEKNVALYRHISQLREIDDLRMPVPMMNVLNGGAHADNNVDIQEFMIVPVGMDKISEAIRCGSEVFQSLKNTLARDGHVTSVGDEGGFAPNLASDQEALQYLQAAVEDAGYRMNHDVVFALDCAATELYGNDVYSLPGQDLTFTGDEFCSYLSALCSDFEIVSIEDGLAEGDWDAWKTLTERLGDKIQLVGDDLFVTNRKYLQKGFEQGVANAILIKLNQIGTLSETLDVIQLAKSRGYSTVISHRSGDTEDTFIADLAVGTGAGQIKTGSLCRSERTSKYNRLLRVEADIGHFEYRGLKEIVRHKESAT